MYKKCISHINIVKIINMQRHRNDENASDIYELIDFFFFFFRYTLTILLIIICFFANFIYYYSIFATDCSLYYTR